MAILTCALAALLILTGLGSLAMSVDLVPTEIGLTYAVSGVILSSAGAIVLAVAALIARLDRIVAPKPAPAPDELALAPDEPAQAPDEPAETQDEPALAPVEAAPEETDAAPIEVGRYVAHGMEIGIYSNGAIEAETEEGRRRFGSMAAFRAYVEARDADVDAG